MKKLKRFWAKIRAVTGVAIWTLTVGFADALPEQLILPVLGGAMLIGFGLVFWAMYDMEGL